MQLTGSGRLTSAHTTDQGAAPAMASPPCLASHLASAFLSQGMQAHKSRVPPFHTVHWLLLCELTSAAVCAYPALVHPRRACGSPSPPTSRMCTSSLGMARATCTSLMTSRNSTRTWRGRWVFGGRRRQACSQEEGGALPAVVYHGCGCLMVLPASAMLLCCAARMTPPTPPAEP